MVVWTSELKIMSNRIVAMRTALVDALKKIDCPTPNPIYPDWSHITSQIGMFAYTGLQVRQRVSGVLAGSRWASIRSV